jgi:hypothetical protein
MASDNSSTRKGPRQRIRHRGDKIREDGAVSALCFKAPRAINMKIATWVYRDEAVTCPRCLEIIHAR